MFPQLTDKSFIKRTPNKEAHVYSFFVNGIRSYICINESASSILALCDGMHSIEDIISILSDKYKEDCQVVEEYVKDFLEPFIKDSFIIDNKVDNIDKRIIRGSLEVNYPSAICWEITNCCPLDCRHCYLTEKNNKIISLDDINSVLKIIDYTGVHQVQITGGEALTHPNLEYIINNLINRGLVTIVSTSGFKFKDNMFDYLKRLKEVRGSMLRVSLDGNKDTHNYVRRNNYAYDTTIEFLKKALNNGIACQVETSLINQSRKELEGLVAMVKELGVLSIEIGPILDQGNAKKNELKSTWSVKEYTDFLEEMNAKYASETFKIRLSEREENSDSKNCGAGYNIIRIKPNFDVTPCPMLDIKLGNLHNETLFNIMSRSNNVFQQLSCPGNESCSGCEQADTCKNCTAAGYSTKDKVKECCWFKNVENSLKYFLDY